MNKTQFNLLLVSILLLVFTACKEKPSEGIKWNFSKFNKLTYDFYQIMENKSPFEKEKQMLSEMKGSIIVAVKDNGKSDVVFKNMKISLLSISKIGDTTQMASQNVPDFFMQDMDEYANIEGQLNQQTELLAQIIFPVPTEDISVGDYNERPTTMPFNMIGSQINVTGFNKIKLESIENDVAQLSTKLDVSDIDIPEDANVNFDCYMKGTSNFTFDIANGYFKSIDLDAKFGAKSLPTENRPDEDANSNEDLSLMLENLELEMHTTIKLVLQEVE